jgi:hypothetical protein
MSDLKVPKRRVEVELVLAGGEKKHGVVFLSPHAHSHGGPERLSDALNGADSFLPLLEDGTMTFVRRDGIALARVAADVESGEDAALPTEFEVRVTLEGGLELAGRISFVLPEGHARLQDYLNAQEPFLALLEDERVATLVNRRRILRVVES